MKFVILITTLGISASTIAKEKLPLEVSQIDYRYRASFSLPDILPVNIRLHTSYETRYRPSKAKPKIKDQRER